MKIDKHIGFRTIGSVPVLLDKPETLVKVATRTYFRSAADRTRGLRLLQDPMLLIAATQSVIGRYRGLVAPKDFFTTRRLLLEFMNSVGDADIQTRLTRAHREEQVFLVNVLQALISAAGAALWEPDVYDIETFAGLTPLPTDLARLSAESVFETLNITGVSATPNFRPLPATVIENVRAAAQPISFAISRALQRESLDARVFSAAAAMVGQTDPRLDVAPFEPLLGTANFIVDRVRREVPEPLEAVTLASQVPIAVSSLMGHPHLVWRSGRDIIDMYSLQRIMSGRTRSATVTFLLPNAVVTNPSAEMFLADVMDTPFNQSGTMVIPAALPQGVGIVERLIAATDAFLTESIGATYQMYEEANPVRRLVTPLSLPEQGTLAALLASDVTYESAGPAATARLSYTFNVASDLEDWEDLVAARTDGTVQTDDPQVLLRLHTPWTGRSNPPERKPIFTGLAKPSLFIGDLSEEDEHAIDTSDSVDLLVQIPQYTLTPSGFRPAENRTENVQMSLHALMNIRALDAHRMLIDPTLRRSLIAKVDMLAHWMESAGIGRPIPDAERGMTWSIGDSAPYQLWGVPGSLEPNDHQNVGRQASEMTAVDALVRYIASPAVKEVFASAVRHLAVPFATPRTNVETTAMLASVRGILQIVVPQLLGLPDAFASEVARIWERPAFESMARTRLRKPNATTSMARPDGG